MDRSRFILFTRLVSTLGFSTSETSSFPRADRISFSNIFEKFGNKLRKKFFRAAMCSNTTVSQCMYGQFAPTILQPTFAKCSLKDRVRNVLCAFKRGPRTVWPYRRKSELIIQATTSSTGIGPFKKRNLLWMGEEHFSVCNGELVLSLENSYNKTNGHELSLESVRQDTVFVALSEIKVPSNTSPPRIPRINTEQFRSWLSNLLLLNATLLYSTP